MLLHEVTSILPPKVLGAQVGKFYAELSHALKKAVLAKDETAFTTATMNFDTMQPNLLFFFTFNKVPKPRPPAITVVAWDILKKHKLKDVVILVFDTTAEDQASFSIDVGMDISSVIDSDSDAEFDAFCDAAVASYKSNIGDVDHAIHT